MDALVDVQAVGGSGWTGAVNRTLNGAPIVLGTISRRTSAAGKGTCHYGQQQNQ